ncbi:hypothetical protein BC940DRAFT_329448 [Gongronella butleri]|nr:hypothetical protein BC940DRAFT_329448 [Gongronella butleri]
MTLLCTRLARPLVHPRRFALHALSHRTFRSSIARRDDAPNPLAFPWLLSSAPRRIDTYPYAKAPQDWEFLNILPKSLQLRLCRWLCERMVTVNTGVHYFPDQFLLGASLSTRKTLELMSQFLTHPSDETLAPLDALMTPTLQRTLLGQAQGCFGLHDNVNVSVPQIYDCTVQDVWVSLGNPDAAEQPRMYQVLEWMTLQVALKRSLLEDDVQEPFADFRARVNQGILEGAKISVDVAIDADVVYQVTRPGEDDDEDEVLVYDRGRRDVLVRFESPTFAPANKMVSERDPDTGEPIIHWQWRIADIDQLVAAHNLEAAAADENLE